MPIRLLLALVGIAAVVFWVLAIIGAMSVAESVTDTPGADIAGLPRYDGSTRSEYRQEPYRNWLLTEVEYVSDAEVGSVRSYFRGLFDRAGWSMDDEDFIRGEWVYVVTDGSREATVEIGAVGDVTEVEIELSEPLPAPGSTTDQ